MVGRRRDACAMSDSRYHPFPQGIEASNTYRIEFAKLYILTSCAIGRAIYYIIGLPVAQMQESIALCNVLRS